MHFEAFLGTTVNLRPWKPLYFPAARVDGHRLMDGGVWANNPLLSQLATP